MENIGSFYSYDMIRLTLSKVWLIDWGWATSKDAVVHVRLGEDMIQAVNWDVHQGTKERDFRKPEEKRVWYNIKISISIADAIMRKEEEEIWSSRREDNGTCKCTSGTLPDFFFLLYSGAQIEPITPWENPSSFWDQPQVLPKSCQALSILFSLHCSLSTQGHRLMTSESVLISLYHTTNNTSILFTPLHYEVCCQYFKRDFYQISGCRTPGRGSSLLSDVYLKMCMKNQMPKGLEINFYKTVWHKKHYLKL